MKKLAIIISHPIQYYTPVFELLAKECELKVFYTWGEAGLKEKFDPGFKKIVKWDIPLLEGYAYQFEVNNAPKPGSHHFSGISNPGLIKNVGNFNPDAILVYGWAYKSHLNLLRYFKGKIPILFRGDSNLLDEEKGLKRVLRYLFLSWIFKHVDKCLYVGTENKAYFEKFGLKPNQLTFAPHAVDNERFGMDRSSEASELRASLNIKREEFLVLFAGKLEEKKNPKLLLQAFLELNSTDVHLLFVGNGGLEQTLREKIKNGNPNVHFIGFQNQQQMPVIYQACDLFCLPSKGPGETWGLAVNEAMAAGKGVLVSNKVGCAVDLVRNSQNGFIFESENLQDLKSKLSLMIDSKENLKLMGQKSKEIIQAWSFQQQVYAITHTFKSTNAGY